MTAESIGVLAVAVKRAQTPPALGLAMAQAIRKVRPDDAEGVIEVLLHPKEQVEFQDLGDVGASLKGGRDMWIIGSAPEVLQVAKDIAEALKVPVLSAAAEAVVKKVENNGSTKVATFLVGEELRTVTLLAVPPAQSRVVCKARPDVIAKHLQGKIRGKDIVIAVTEENRLATGLAVARCLPPFVSKADMPSPADATVRFYGAAPGPLLAKLNHMAAAIRLAQGLVDMPPNFIQPATLKEFVLAATKGLDKVTAHVIEGTELRDKGYGGLWNVGKSADQRPPCLIVLTHNPSGMSADGGPVGVALVGKGITYDTGGAALKPREGMCGMKRDMGGAAGVFGAWLAAVKCGGLPTGAPLHCVLCIAENGIGPGMFLNDDIILHYSGLTSEINNTDAEGRLVLADGVAHAVKNLGAELIVDMATLTGAQAISTGKHFSSILASDEALEKEIVDAGRVSGEGAHPGLFAPELLLSEFDSEFADMKNSVKDRSNAQSSCAGLFIYKHLKHAGHQGRWIHCDMYYPSFVGEYATGYGVGLLCTQLGVV
ncbi:Npepl1 [Symbiodinium sp. CCMP2592]|nr:Npepl1 [Symbiodinium sp. CCMP2592]